MHAEPLAASIREYANAPDPGRRLRVGFVSPDFGRHPVAYFLIRAFENLDRTEWETICYSDRLNKDELTARFQSAATIWRDIQGVSDKRVAAMITADQIDILFDLAGHTAHNRLLVFARKPAPIQITWIGYEGTTGLAAIDYILADSLYDSAGPNCIPRAGFAHAAWLRLLQPAGMPHRPSPLPATKAAAFVSAASTTSGKITPQVIEAWAEVFIACPVHGWSSS